MIYGNHDVTAGALHNGTKSCQGAQPIRVRLHVCVHHSMPHTLWRQARCSTTYFRVVKRVGENRLGQVCVLEKAFGQDNFESTC